jgi:hypothetical protein
MPVVRPPLHKKCINASCENPKNPLSYNDDFYNDNSQKDYKDVICKLCRKKRVYAGEARYKYKKTPSARVTKRRAAKEINNRMLGENVPITATELEELVIWLQHPDAWEGVTTCRRRIILCGLKRILNQIKYFSTWHPRRSVHVK